jgi:hypothetical protein
MQAMPRLELSGMACASEVAGHLISESACARRGPEPSKHHLYRLDHTLTAVIRLLRRLQLSRRVSG